MTGLSAGPAVGATQWPDGCARLKPSFLIIGAHKCGTTSLHHYLVKHRHMVQATRKEIHFFDRHYARGAAWYAAHFPRAFPVAVLRGAMGRRSIAGEATPSYLYHPLAPGRVRAMLPDARLIALVRDPVERAISHWRVAHRKGWDDAPDIETALDREAERMAGHAERMAADENYVDDGYFRHAYMARGRYAEQLARWFDLFGRERVLVLQAERLFADPAAVTGEACAFLGLDADPRVGFDVHNKGSGKTVDDDGVRVRLREYFGPHNAELRTMLGDGFDWGY